jgi:CDP-glucose 4,6-dehydratase
MITGHTGFKGSWLALWLHALGARVIGYALPPPTEPSNFVASGVDELLYRQYMADIRDDQALTDALRSTEPELVLHLAAQTVVRESYVRPAETFSVNVMGTVALLEAIRQRARPCAVVVVSSDKCYANDDSGRAFDEDDALGGSDPYSASKGGQELVAGAYRSSFFQPAALRKHAVAVASARAGNVVGGGDWTPDGLIADAMRSLRLDEPIRLRNPSAIRPWQHVLEPLAGYLTLASKLLGPEAARYCGAWNFGPGEGSDATVQQVIDKLLEHWGKGNWQDSSQPDQPHEASVLRLTTTRAATRLGWRPRFSLDQTVGRTAAWYRRYFDDPNSARAACLDDLVAYAGASSASAADASRTTVSL